MNIPLNHIIIIYTITFVICAIWFIRDYYKAKWLKEWQYKNSQNNAKVVFITKKKLLTQIKDYKLECDGINHYFTGKITKNKNIGKCWCKNE